MAALVIACTAACSAGPAEPAAAEPLYATRWSDGNTFACASCHAITEPAADGFRRPGHPIGDAAHRPTFKDGQLTDLRAAVNTCLVGWMGVAAVGEDDPRWATLRAWLEGQAPPGPAPAIDLQIVDPPTDPGGGDAARGQTLFNGACAVCHGADAVGTERAPSLRGLPLVADHVAARIRRGGPEDSPVYPDLGGGRMPFWGADRLSDDELRDAVAFVLTLADEPAGGVDAGPPTGADAGDCSASHPRVGWTGRFVTRFHGVAGEATVRDDCTLEVAHFTYDGGGIDVQAYAATGTDFAGGFSISGNLRRAAGYADETVRFRLPAGRTWDDVDAVSIWCVDVGVSFGEVVLAAPE